MLGIFQGKYEFILLVETTASFRGRRHVKSMAREKYKNDGTSNRGENGHSNMKVAAVPRYHGHASDSSDVKNGERQQELYVHTRRAISSAKPYTEKAFQATVSHPTGNVECDMSPLSQEDKKWWA